MKLIKTGSNTTELQLHNGITVLFSYNTPVACEDSFGNIYRTNKKFSSTTSRHISAFTRGCISEERDQSYFDELVK